MRSDKSQTFGKDFNTNSKSLFRQVTIKRKEDGLSCRKDVLEIGDNLYKAQT